MRETRSPPAVDPLCGGLLPILPEAEDRIALRNDRGREWSRSDLRREALDLAGRLGCDRKKLVFLETGQCGASLIGLLAAAAAGHAVALIDPALGPDKRDRLVAAYAPDLVVTTSVDSETIQTRAITADRSAEHPAIHPDLLLLLSTSGTTGSAKFVRLSARALVANARQIATVLDVDMMSTAVAHLPFHYSYGLSVLTSHLVVGGAVAVIDDAVTSPSFWAKVADANGTHFPGVPFHYATLARLGFGMVAPSLTTFTQAGGSLDLRFQKIVYEQVQKRGGRFFVMYGQTEAAPRMTTLPSELWAEKLGSVGKALPEGTLTILGSEGQAVVSPEVVGAVVYQGPNVMMGYSETRAELGLGDTTGGLLHTGDIGRLDSDGYLFLQGRMKRFAKIAGLRLGLDEIEREIGTMPPVYCLDAGDKVAVCHEGPAPDALKARLRAIATEYKVPPNSFAVHEVAAIPRKSSGKIDYARLGDEIRVRTAS